MAVPEGLQGGKFDDGYDASHCMKAVGFVFEAPDRDLFIELKDPEHPKAPPVSADDYLGRSLRDELVGKFRDTGHVSLSMGAT